MRHDAYQRSLLGSSLEPLTITVSGGTVASAPEPISLLSRRPQLEEAQSLPAVLQARQDRLIQRLLAFLRLLVRSVTGAAALSSVSPSVGSAIRRAQRPSRSS